MNIQKSYSIYKYAELFGCSPETVRRHVKNGEVPSVRLGRRISIPAWYVTEKLCRPNTHMLEGKSNEDEILDSA